LKANGVEGNEERDIKGSKRLEEKGCADAFTAHRGTWEGGERRDRENRNGRNERRKQSFLVGIGQGVR